MSLALSLLMMSKVFSIFIQLILILKIAFSSKWTRIEKEDFEAINKQKNQLNNFSSATTHFGNANIVQPKFKLNHPLIFLSIDKFKYCILPYLSTHDFVKIYLHFQNLVPELNLETFLPPSRFYTTNDVLDIQEPLLDIQEPKPYLQPLEINLLYQFNGEYSSLQPHILYFSKNKIPNVFETEITIPPDSICALFSENKIIPYETYVIPTSHQELLILKNDEFCVTLQKSKHQFINIAKGNGVSKNEFLDYVECIWEAYNLQGWEKNYWKIKSFLTMTFVKYFVYISKITSSIGFHLLHIFEIFSNNIEKASISNHPCEVFGYEVCLVAYIPLISVAGYIIFCLWYYAILLPFFILAFPLKNFVLEYSYLFLSQSLASLYVYFFPQIKKFIPLWSFGTMEQIEPPSMMTVVPLLVQKRRNSFWIEWLSTIGVCCLIFLFGFPLSLLFLMISTFFLLVENTCEVVI